MASAKDTNTSDVLGTESFIQYNEFLSEQQFYSVSLMIFALDFGVGGGTVGLLEVVLTRAIRPDEERRMRHQFCIDCIDKLKTAKSFEDLKKYLREGVFCKSL
eukprot:984005-Amphidinium_carterae.1